MDKDRKPNILAGSDENIFSELNRILSKRGIRVDRALTADEFLAHLRENFYEAAVMDTTAIDFPIPEMIMRAKSVSQYTEIIMITEPGQEGGPDSDNPLDSLVYGYVETPVNINYVATLALKAVEKQRLVKSSAGGKSSGRKNVIERATSGDESALSLLLSTSVNSLNSAVMITDTKHNIIYINNAHTRTFGYTPDELMGKKSDALYPLDDPSGVSSKIYEALIMVGWEGERLAMRKDGNAFPVYEKTSAVKDRDGRQIGVVSVTDDITARKRLQQALKESEERYRSFVETAKSAIIAVDGEGRIILFNPAAEEIFGYGKEEIMNKEFRCLFPERYKDITSAELGKGTGSGFTNLKETTTEITGLTKNGEEFSAEVSFSTCRVEGRTILTAIIFDITERKNLQEQLLQSAKLAAVGELISGVTHEVNNPLAVVIGYSEMLLSEPELGGEARDAIRAIHAESERAKKVIQNMLSFARKHNPEKEVIQVNDVIEKTLGLTDYELRKNSVTVVKDLDPDLPETVADPNQLQQVFLNLIINSQQAMSETEDTRQLTIRSRLKEPEGKDAGKRNVIQVAFEDNGPGIPDASIKKIFDPFYTTKPKGKGTGLGLSVSFGIIKEHGGEIFVKPNDGKGVTFFVELPA
ncbi:MAG TPA: PAS domain S-box protein [Thermodesulfobacteriota bacterium]|nr:PAS domain S-box protein [Thermodesulfobacteriota bacterium]